MTPAETRTRILADAARRIDRAQRCHPHALALASAAARQYALPYWTAADSRQEDRRERNSFTQATRTFRGMTDWRQTRGQSREARIRAGLRRARYFSLAALVIPRILWHPANRGAYLVVPPPANYYPEPARLANAAGAAVAKEAHREAWITHRERRGTAAA